MIDPKSWLINITHDKELAEIFEDLLVDLALGLRYPEDAFVEKNWKSLGPRTILDSYEHDPRDMGRAKSVLKSIVKEYGELYPDLYLNLKVTRTLLLLTVECVGHEIRLRFKQAGRPLDPFECTISYQ